MVVALGPARLEVMHGWMCLKFEASRCGALQERPRGALSPGPLEDPLDVAVVKGSDALRGWGRSTLHGAAHLAGCVKVRTQKPREH